MRSIFAVFMVAIFTVVGNPAFGQTVRFQTNAGSFDLLLNPTNNPNLQPLVENMLAYVNSGRYANTLVNRAAEDFVLQMGVFKTNSVLLSEIPINGFTQIDHFSPVIVDTNNDGSVDFSTAGLTNVRGAVSLALSAGNANSGTSSFFVNIKDNSFLDNQGFVPFATVVNMAPIDAIMALNQADISPSVGQPGSLAYIDVPLSSPGNLVVIQNAIIIVPEPKSVALIIPVLAAFAVAYSSKRKRHQNDMA